MADFDEKKEREAFYDWLQKQPRPVSMADIWVARARHQPSAPALPTIAINNAICSVERDLQRCIEARDSGTEGSAYFHFHNQAVKQCESDINSLRALLPPAEQ